MTKRRLERLERQQSGYTHLRVTKATRDLVMQLHKAEQERTRPRQSWYRYSRYDLTVDDVIYELVASALEAALTTAVATTDVNNVRRRPTVKGVAGAAVNESAIANSLTNDRRKRPTGRRGA